MNIRKRILTQLFCSKIDCPRFSFTRTWRSAASSASRPSGTRKISGLTRPRIRWRNIFLNYLPHLFKQAIIGIFFPILPFQNTDVKFSIILKLSVYQKHFPRLIRLKLSPFRSNLNNICLPKRSILFQTADVTKVYSCLFCQKLFANFLSANACARVHTRSFECQVGNYCHINVGLHCKQGSLCLQTIFHLQWSIQTECNMQYIVSDYFE